MENQTPKMISLNVNMTEQESRTLSKFLKKTVSALKHTIREHEQAKIKAETIIKLHELEKENEEDDDDLEMSPLHDIFSKLTGQDPVESARDFLKHYDKCVNEHQEAIIVMTILLENVKSQVIK